MTYEPYRNRAGEPIKLIEHAKYTEGMHWFARFAARIGERLLKRAVRVAITGDSTWEFDGAYSNSGCLIVNKGRLGGAFFTNMAHGRMLAFLIDQLAHGHRLSYIKALPQLGGELAELALRDPALFGWIRHGAS